jgi:hypothetical protein
MRGQNSDAVRLPSSARLSRPAVRLLIPIVLLGLWMMHGMSATMESGCHGMVPTSLAASMSDSPAMSAMSAVKSTPVRAGMTTASPAGSVELDAGELCLSGQPPAPGDWALALLAALALVGCIAFALAAGQPGVQRTAGSRWWRGPPDPAGRELLTTVCVSRT